MEEKWNEMDAQARAMMLLQAQARDNRDSER
jgi:hypothetical protein